MSADAELLKAELGRRKKLIDEDIAAYTKQLLADTEAKFGAGSRDALAAYCAILGRGGKRIRGSLVMGAYEMVGGTNTALALQAARIAEIFHAYLLIIDDIADRSATRRGGPAAHMMMEEYHHTHKLHGSAAHFGISMAMTAAYLGAHLAQLEFAQFDLPAEQRLEAIGLVNDYMILTGHGQLNDILNEAERERVTPAAIDQVSILKTAHYTFIGPLQFGALMGGATAEERATLVDYGRNLGLAFQIADDIIGTFGEVAETGKSNRDDLAEGKMTLLVQHALAEGSEAQRQALTQALGNATMSDAQYEAAKAALRDTGALDYAQQQADHYAAAAAEALSQLPSHWSPQHLAMLRSLTDYVVHRAS